MRTLTIECLSCGQCRQLRPEDTECLRCGYVGWAPSSDLSERVRRVFRDVPVAQRRLIRAL